MARYKEIHLNDLDSQIAFLKDKINKAQLAKMRAEASKETALINYAAAMKDLQDKFGVDNPQQARDKLMELQRTLDTKMADVRNVLDEINL